MSRWIETGAARDTALPSDRLTPDEFAELQRVLGERNGLVSQVQVLEQRLQLLMLVARDRRGLSGQVRIDAETGALQPLGSIDGKP